MPVGEWPRSSRSLLHRVAALALSGSPSAGNGHADGGEKNITAFSLVFHDGGLFLDFGWQFESCRFSSFIVGYLVFEAVGFGFATNSFLSYGLLLPLIFLYSHQQGIQGKDSTAKPRQLQLATSFGAVHYLPSVGQCYSSRGSSSTPWRR